MKLTMWLSFALMVFIAAHLVHASSAPKVFTKPKFKVLIASK